MPTWNEEHLEVVKKGADAIKHWRNAHPGESLKLSRADLSRADLCDADLDRANLTRADLPGANLRGATLTNTILVDAELKGALLHGAILTRADLTTATLNGANLTAANLSGANLTNASLVAAHLVDATLSGANLSGAKLLATNLTGASLCSTNLEDADFTIDENEPNWWHRLYRRPTWWLDSCRVHKTRFHARARDPWSVLRRTYTGPRFILTLFLLLAFIAPRIGKAMFWKGVEKAETRLERTISTLSDELDNHSEDHPESAALVKRIIVPLEEYGDFESDNWERHKIGGLVLDFHQSWWAMALALVLVAFNLARAMVMWFVAPMRDAEERSQVTPAKDDYEKWFWVHRLVVTPLFVVSVCAFLWSMFDLLFTTVYLPA